MTDNIVQGKFGAGGSPKGGGGSDDMLEARVGRLEEDVKELKSDMKAVRSDLSYIKGRLDAMPTTIQLLGFVIAIFVAAGVAKFFMP